MPVDRVLLDGGPTSNDWLMQLQADLSQRTVLRSRIAELSALGAAVLAGAIRGLWDADAAPDDQSDAFTPRLDARIAAVRRRSWSAAVASARDADPSRSEQTSTTSTREHTHVQ